MFEIGWSELLVIAVVAIIVVGPKELPRMLRTFGGMLGKMRRMANEFQTQFNDVLREAERQAELDDIKKQVQAAKNFDPLKDVKTSLTDAVSTPPTPLPPATGPAAAATAASEPAAPAPSAEAAAAAPVEPAAAVPVGPVEAAAAVPAAAPAPEPVATAQPVATVEATETPKPASGGGAA